MKQLLVLRPGGLRRGSAVFSGQEQPRLLSHPDWSDQQIDRSLEKRRMIALNPVSQKQKRPSADEKCRSPEPLHENEQKEAHENHAEPYTVQQFIPAGRMFLIVLRHVVRQTQSAPPCGDGSAERSLYIKLPPMARARDPFHHQGFENTRFKASDPA